MSVIGRSAGRSAVAAAAYRLGERLHEQETDRTHDYTRRSGVVTTLALAPEDAPQWAREPEALWNAASAADTRRNSQIAREWELALPAAVSAEEREGIARDFAHELVDRYRVGVTVAIHEPGRGDDRNHHAHFLMTTRRISEDGLGEKVRELVTKNTGAQEVAYLRGYACGLINDALERSGSDERVDHRNFSDRGIAREPTMHLGPKSAAMERRGMESERGDFNREVAERNAEREQLDRLVSELAALDAEIAREQQERVLGEGFVAFEPQAPDLPVADPEIPASGISEVAARIDEAWPPLMPDAPAEDMQVQAEAASFTADIEQQGEVREVEQEGGLSWWQRGAQFVAQAIDQAREYVRGTWERISREDKDRDIEPDIGPG